MNIRSLFPDLRSGTVVFLVALPLCLGIALACGVPLFSGIIAGVVGGLIVAAISGSKYSVSGPAAGLTSIVIAAIASLGSYPSFLAAAVLAGFLQIVLGLLGAGCLGAYIPNAVIKGMLAGIGIILIIKQLPHFVGYDADTEGDMYFVQSNGHNTLSDLYYMLNYITPGAVLIGCASLLVLLVTEMKFYTSRIFLSFIPGPLLVVACGIVLNMLFVSSPLLQLGQEHLVHLPTIRSTDDLSAHLIFPDFRKSTTQEFWIVVLTLAVVASLETLLSLEAVEKLDPRKESVNANRELLAQGTGNMLSAAIGGLPITSVIVRSSANINVGARTRFSAMFHAMLLVSSLLFFPGLLCLIPNASLAVILMMTGYKLTKISLFKEQFKMGWDQFLPFVTTIVVMLLTDLLKGVGAGILVALYYIIRYNVRSFEVIEAEIEGRRNYLIRLPQHITFFNKGFLSRYLARIKKGSQVIIDGSITKSTDKDVREVFRNFVETSEQRKLEIRFIKYTLEH